MTPFRKSGETEMVISLSAPEYLMAFVIRCLGSRAAAICQLGPVERWQAGLLETALVVVNGDDVLDRINNVQIFEIEFDDSRLNL